MTFLIGEQNGEDLTQNVFSLNFDDSKQGQELRLKHVLKQFPLDLENSHYHLRFKIQCNEIEPKIFAWIDPSNLNARAPIINNAIYVKILKLNKEGDSKIFTKEKITKAISQCNEPSGESQIKQQPHQRTHQPSPDQSSHSATKPMHKINSQPDLVHQHHMEQPDLFDPNVSEKQPSHANQKKVEVKQTPQQLPKVVQKVPPKDVNIFGDDDDDDQGHTVSAPQQQQQILNNNSQRKEINNFFDDDFEVAQPSVNNVVPSNNSVQKTNPAVPSNGVHLLDGHISKPQESEFDIMVKARANEYTDAKGNIDRQSLLRVKEEVQKFLEEKRVEQNRLDQESKANYEIEKKLAREKLSSKINDWKESNGVRKDIRTLLSTLQNVLWQGANWTPVSFFDLSTEENLKESVNLVKKRFHPDRNRDSTEKRFICEQLIDEVSKAYKDYQAKPKS